MTILDLKNKKTVKKKVVVILIKYLIKKIADCSMSSEPSGVPWDYLRLAVTDPDRSTLDNSLTLKYLMPIGTIPASIP